MQKLRFFFGDFTLVPLVEWLERLGYSAESRRKARVRGWVSLRDDWKILAVNPAVNGYLFRIRATQGDFHQLCPRYSGTLPPLPLRLLGYGKHLSLPL